MKKEKSSQQKAEQITPEESLKRMKNFAARKEAFIAAVKKSKN